MKFPAIKHIPEMPEAEVGGEQLAIKSGVFQLRGIQLLAEEGEGPPAAAAAAAADAAGCTAGEDGRGFDLPLCRAVARDPAGSFTLATAERGGRAAPAAAVAVGCCSGTEGGEVFGLPPCRAIARDPEGSFTLAFAEGGGPLRASATTLALPGTCLTSEVSSARKDSCRWTRGVHGSETLCRAWVRSL